MHVTLFSEAHEILLETRIPDFKTPPEVLIWGQKVFIWSEALRHVDLQPDSETYIETFAFHVYA